MQLANKNRSGYCKCGIFREVLHRDHVIPKWKGGSDEESNVQYLCPNCHQDKTLAEVHSEEFRAWRREGNKKRYENPAEVQKIIDGWTPERRVRQSIAQKKRFENPTERMKASLTGKGVKWTEARKAQFREVVKNRRSTSEVCKAAQQKRRIAEAERKQLLTPEQREQKSILISIKRAEMKLARILVEGEAVN